MLHFLSRRSIIVFIALFQLFAGNAKGQTMPVPQALPYTQTFSTFNGAQTTYPAGWQGWTEGSDAIGAAVDVNAPVADQPLVAGVNNGSTSAFVGDMVGKMGMLSTGSNIRSACLAVNATGVTNLVVTFTAATQEQVGPPSGRVDQLNLQYRVGTTGPFTTVSGAAYQNDNLAPQTSGTNGTTPTVISALLPSACDNSPTVQVRWIESDLTGSGTRPSFSITNISVSHGVVTTYYSKGSGNLDVVGTWGTNTDGTGTAPTNFTGNLHEFHIANGNPGIITTNWVVSGTASKIVVDGADFTIPTTHTVTATIDVNAGRTLTIQNTTLPTLGSLDQSGTPSTVIFKNLPSLTIPGGSNYGNITFDGTTVPTPVANASIVFAGNFSLINSSSISGSFSTFAYNLVTVGNNNQMISANGNPFTVRNIDVGSTNIKTAGIVSLAANTNITATNSLLMNLAPPTQFADGGNTITVDNNIDLTGTATGYNFTGILNVTAQGTGSANFRGGGVSTLPCVAAFNNVNFNNTIPVQIRPTGITLTINGNLTIASVATPTVSPVEFNGNTLSIGGNFICNSTTDVFDMSTAASVLAFNGSEAQSYTTAVTNGNTVTNLTINNTGTGLTLNNRLNVTGTLTLTAGKINTGTNTLNLSSTATVSGGSAASYVNGGLSKAMPVGGAATIQYEVGDATYSPVQFSFGSTVTTGSLVVRSTAGAHPQIAGSYINTANMVNRFWTITSNGFITPSINAAVNYAGNDITDIGHSNAGYILRQYTGSTWVTDPSVTNTTGVALPLPGDATTTVGVTSFTGDYVAGLPACSVPTAGVANGTPVSLCASGTSVISLTGASSGNSIGYQWSSSANGTTFTPISGATNATYTTPTISATTYYNATLTCLLTNSVSPSAATTATVTVNPLPPAITAPVSQVCEGLTIGLSDATTGGTWTSSNTTHALVDPVSGVVTGVLASTPTIIYTLPTGCITTKTITVNPSPSAIIGATSICDGLTATLSNTVAGGVWSSSNSAVATISSATRVVHATTLGNTTITYQLPAGCIATSTISVVSSPNVILGPSVLCTERPVTLSDAAGSGTWSSNNTAVVIGATTGTVVAHATGSATIVYSLGTGCQSVTTVTVNQSPADITGIANICLGGNITLHDVTGGGTWSSSNPAFATVSPTGLVTSVSPGADTIIYGITNGCTSIAPVTVNPTSPISGIATICQGGSLVVSDIVPGGIWTSSNATIAAVGSTDGTVSGIAAGTAIITYTLPTTCFEVALATVNALPMEDTVLGGGSYCSGSGGLHITLDSSEVGVNYQLYNGSTATGGLVAGNGHLLDLGAQTAAGTYTVMATNAITHCTNNMIGSTGITVEPLPAVFNVIGGGGYCLGDLSGVAIGLDSSEASVNYQLMFGGFANGSAVPGTGDSITFGSHLLAGGYSVIATSTVTSCTVSMTGTATVSINLPPTPHTVTATNGGNYCVGGTGVHIDLSGSATGVKYMLYHNGLIDSSLAGTGSALDYGLFTAVGTYTISATDTTTGCSSGMLDSALVVVNPIVMPTVNISTGIGAGNMVCLGSPVTFTAQTTNGGAAPTYAWLLNGFFVGTTDSTYNYIPANGDVIKVELHSSAMCTVPDTAVNTMVVQVDSPVAPSVFIVASPSTRVYTGTRDTLTAIVTNGGPAPLYQWYNNGVIIPGATSATYISNSFSVNDSVSCMVTSSGACGGLVTINAVVITLSTAGVTQVSQSDDIKLFPNPNMGTFTVKGSLGVNDNQDATLVVTDMLGQVIYTKNVTVSNGSINEQIILSNALANGVYLLQVHSGAENKTFHFVVGK